MQSLTLHPNAKINLGLSFKGKRQDGYHLLETVFMPVPLADRLVLIVQDGLAANELAVTGPYAIPSTPDNLVLKAWQALKQRVPALPFVRVELEKNIPSRAGLGGGSSDAAHVLKGLNELLALGLPDDVLEEMALPLGADVPFFIQNKPLLAKGIGEIFEPIEVNLSGYRIELVTPPVHSDTREAYCNLRPEHWSVECDVRAVLALPVEQWRGRLVNDFEASVFARFPQLAAAKEALYARGAVYAAMSGSGSALFGIFRV